MPVAAFESLAAWAAGAQALGLLRGALDSGLLAALRKTSDVERLTAVTGRSEEWLSAVCQALEAHGIVERTAGGWKLSMRFAALLEEDAQQPLGDFLVSVDARIRAFAAGGALDGGYRALASSDRVAIARGLGMSPLSREGRAGFARMAALLPELAERWRLGADHLEAGCGVGNALLAFVVEFPQLRAEGIELDAVLIGEARRRAAVLKVEDRVRLRQLDVAELEDEQRFDSAQWSQMFFSAGSRPPALRALHRALRPGGLLLMPTLPLRSHPSPESSLKRALIASWDVPVRSEAALRAEVENAEFEVLAVGLVEPRPLLLSEGYLVARRA